MLGYRLMGGHLSTGAAIAGLMGGLTSGLVLLFFHRLAVTESSDGFAGVVLVASALAIAFQAIACRTRP